MFEAFKAALILLGWSLLVLVLASLFPYYLPYLLALVLT